MRSGVTAVIPTIPPRVHYLERATHSVLRQTRTVDAVSIAVDQDHAGSAITRNLALAAVQTEWTAFLDDDDEWLPEHVASLLEAAEETGADIVYPWFLVPNGYDCLEAKGKPFDADDLRKRNYIPVTVLARTELLLDVGGFENQDYDPTDPYASACDEWSCWLKLLDKEAAFHHLNRLTWVWNWHGKHTSGRGDRW